MTAAVAIPSSAWASLLTAGTDVTVAAGTDLAGLLPPGEWVLVDPASAAASPPLDLRVTLAPLALSAAAVPEDAPADTLVGSLSGSRPGSTLALADDAGGRFRLAAGALRTTGVPLDHEARPVETVVVTETFAGAVNSPLATALDVAVTNAAEGPVLVSVSPAAGSAGAGVTAPIAWTFDRPVARGPNFHAGLYGSSLTVEWTQVAPAGTGPGQVEIAGNTLTLHLPTALTPGDAFVRTLHYESLVDASGNTLDASLADGFATGSAPLIAGPSGAPGAPVATATLPEGTAVPALIHTYAASVPATWSLAGGADAGDFAIDAATGALRLLAPADYEGLAGKAAFTVVVRATATAGGATTDQTLALGVANVDEGEPVLTLTGFDDATKALTVDVSEAATLHWASHPAGSPPARAQLVAGTGGGIHQAGSFAAASGVAQAIAVTEPGTPLGTRGLSLLALDASGNPSAVVTTTFTMVAAGDTTPPALSAATAGPSGAWSVATTEGNGTLYAAVTAGGAPPTAAQVRAGAGGGIVAAGAPQAVSAPGAQTGTFPALPAGTYVAHFAQQDAAGNLSAVASSAGFTVAGSGSGPSLAVRLAAHAEAEQSGSDIAWTAVPVDPAATALVALVTYRGPGNVSGLTVGGLAATLIGSVASAGGTVSQSRAYRVAAPGGWTSADVVLDGQSAGSGGGLLTLLSVSGLAGAGFTGAAPANGATAASATQDVVAGDALYAHLWGTAAPFAGLAWTGAASLRATEAVASDPYYAAVASQAVAATATGHAVAAAWTNATSNNLLLGVLRLRGS